MKYYALIVTLFSLCLCLLICGFKVIDEKKTIDDCCCELGVVLDSNQNQLYPLLNQLVNTRFFQYFKLDLFSECPFWASDFMCGIESSCGICECNEDEVPKFWNSQKTDLVDRSTPANFVGWNDAEDNMWIIQGPEEEMSFVNLRQFPESHTEFNGSLVWNAIYNENCFTGPVDSMCLEERVFYKLISGMHASINTHISRNYQLNKETGEWIYNISMFKERIQDHPERIENLYFAFLFLLRAVTKAAPVLREYHYNTGNEQEARILQSLVRQFLSVDLLCSPTFNEGILFSDPEKESLRHQVKSHFRNISQIMNCVTCEKCKTYSKLQVLAMGTALKILLEPNTELVLKQLQRNEIIALINTLRQFSSSIESIRYLSSLENSIQAETPTIWRTNLLLIAFGSIIVRIFLAYKRTVNAKRVVNNTRIIRNTRVASNTKVIRKGKRE